MKKGVNRGYYRLLVEISAISRSFQFLSSRGSFAKRELSGVCFPNPNGGKVSGKRNGDDAY